MARRNSTKQASISKDRSRSRKAAEKAVDEGVAEWKRTLDELNAGKSSYRFRGHVYLRMRDSEIELLTREQEELLKDGTYFRQIVAEFLINELYPQIEKLWNMGPGGAGAARYLPQWTTLGSGARKESSMVSLDQDEDLRKNLAEREASVVRHTGDTMRQGFQRIIETLGRVHSRSEGDTVVAGLGNRAELFGLRLSEYMPVRTQSRSPLNSLFLAAEYGTGIAENVGGSRYVRYSTSMPSKDKGASEKERGAWFFAPQNSTTGGMRFTGQRGAHVFYDETTRTPRPEIYNYIQDHFRDYFLRALSRKLGGLGIVSA